MENRRKAVILLKVNSSKLRMYLALQNGLCFLSASDNIGEEMC